MRILLFAVLLAAAGAAKPTIIIEADDRKDYYEAGAAARGWAESTVAVFAPGKLTKTGEGWALAAGDSFGGKHGLCAGERFFDQPVAAECSGVFVGRDLVLTAGHCVDEGPGRLFVFGYRMLSKGEAAETFGADAVYVGKDVVSSYVKGDPASDWALVRLDRPVKGRAALSLGTDPPVGEPLTIVGHPFGLPVKANDDAKAVEVGDGVLSYYSDLAGGSSGSPILDSSGKVVGLHVEGNTYADFVASRWVRRDVSGLKSKALQRIVDDCPGRDETTAAKGECVGMHMPVNAKGGYDTAWLQLATGGCKVETVVPLAVYKDTKPQRGVSASKAADTLAEYLGPKTR